MTIKGQRKKEIFSIENSHQSILWINISAPSIGDSLMDLSSRVLLKGRATDLFTDKKNSHIYLSDQIFQNVFTDISQIKIDSYDLIILDSYSTRSVRVKSKIAPNLNFVGMFGYFNGPEVHRILYSFNRMNQLLGYPFNDKKISKIAKNYISISHSDQELVQSITPDDFISIVLGGDWSYRNYRNWDKVIERLVSDNPELIIAFIGSNNAIDISEQLVTKFSNYNIINFVNKLTFNQTVELIKRGKITLCCDGGLLHGSEAVGAKVLALFARLKPEILLTKNNFCYTIYNESNVNNILPNKVISEYYKAIKSDRKVKEKN